MSVEHNYITLDEVQKHIVDYGRSPVLVSTAREGTKIDISKVISDPETFYGKPYVDHLVQFGDTFEPLIGEYDGRYGKWNPEDPVKEGVFILEKFSLEAARLMKKINALAQRFVDDQKLYDDPAPCGEFFDMAGYGYHLLKSCEGTFGNIFSDLATPVSFERAGLVCTRLAMGLGADEIIPGEVRVTTKRAHVIGEPETYLSASVDLRNKDDLPTRIDGSAISINDFVNPASGASTAAFILAAREGGYQPSVVAHRAISVTQQGVMFNKVALAQLGVKTSFYSLGECDKMNEHYYLTGRPVADAGHILRHSLPSWYKE